MSDSITEQHPPLQLVVDCDPGIDDAIALAYLAGEARHGLVALRETIAVRGNLGVDQAGRNAAFILDLLGFEHVRVARGADEALTPLPMQLDASAVHGRDGLGGQHDLLHPDRSTAASGDEVSWMLAEAAGFGATVLALGPLTNMARALRTDPSLGKAMGRLVVMGGAFGNPSGNATEYAEYNFHVDAGAAGEVLSAGIDTLLVPLDAADRLLLRTDDLDTLSNSAIGRFLDRLLRTSIEIHERRWGLDGCLVHDAVTAVLALFPDLATVKVGSVTTVIDGNHAGRSAFTEGPGSVAVAFDLDVGGVRSTLLEALARL